MKMYAKLAISLVALMVAVGCSKKDDSPTPNDNPWGNGGSGGSSASGGAGGTNVGGKNQGGTGGQAQGGSSGSGGQAQGGSGGQAQGGSAGQGGQTLDGGADAFDDSGPDYDALPDAPPPPVDTCSTGSIAFGSKNLVAGGETTQAFADAFNAEVQAMTAPGPLLIELNGLDVADESTNAWKMKLGPLTWDGSAASFSDTPGELPFTFSSGWGVYAKANKVSFKLHFASGDIPVSEVNGFGGSLMSKACDTLAVEQFELVIPQDKAKDIPFHGSTVSALMGAPNRDCCGGTSNAWVLSLATNQNGLTVVKTK